MPLTAASKRRTRLLVRDFILPQNPRWAKALRGASHDVYALPQYALIAAKSEEGHATAFYAEEAGSVLLVPLIQRPLPPSGRYHRTGIDFISPYGYPSLVAAGSDTWLLKALQAFCEAAMRLGAVTALLRLNPLFPLPGELLSKFGEVISHGHTVYIDLKRSEHQLWAETQPRLRSQIRHLQRNGFEVTIDDWSEYNGFIDAYYETMSRVQAAKYYSFPRTYFHALRTELAGYLHFCRVLAPSGELSCAGLFTSCNGILQYHLGATAPSHMAFGPSKLMMHAMRLWGQRTGHIAMHLGGGFGGRADSLFRFKSHFSSTRAVYSTMRMVFDNSAYSQLIAHLRPDATASGFFPPYRNPGADSTAAGFCGGGVGIQNKAKKAQASYDD